MYCYTSATLISDILTSQSGPPAAGAPRMGCRGRQRRQMHFRCKYISESHPNAPAPASGPGTYCYISAILISDILTSQSVPACGRGPSDGV